MVESELSIAPRTANVLPSSDTRTSGRGALAAQTMPTCPEQHAAPAQRRLEQTDDQQASGQEQQRPGAKAGDVTDGAGQARHPQRNLIHPIDAVTHLPPAFGIEAERNGDEAQQAHRHDPGRNDRHGQQVREHAVGREAMKVIGGIRRGGEAGDQRGDDQAQRLVDAPQRGAGVQRAVAAAAHPRHAAIVGRDQRQRRRKRHLETRMHHRLRRQAATPAAPRSSACGSTAPAGRA